jgi:hypothetical protein
MPTFHLGNLRSSACLRHAFPNSVAFILILLPGVMSLCVEFCSTEAGVENGELLLLIILTLQTS